MVRSTRKASVRRDSVGRNPWVEAEVAGSARRRNGRLAAVVNGRRGGRPPPQALPHNGALSLAEPQSQQVGSARQDVRHHAAVRSTSTCRSQPSSWFQLAKMRLTTLPKNSAISASVAASSHVWLRLVWPKLRLARLVGILNDDLTDIGIARSR